MKRLSLKMILEDERGGPEWAKKHGKKDPPTGRISSDNKNFQATPEELDSALATILYSLMNLNIFDKVYDDVKNTHDRWAAKGDPIVKFDKKTLEMMKHLKDQHDKDIKGDRDEDEEEPDRSPSAEQERGWDASDDWKKGGSPSA